MKLLKKPDNKSSKNVVNNTISSITTKTQNSNTSLSTSPPQKNKSKSQEIPKLYNPKIPQPPPPRPFIIFVGFRDRDGIYRKDNFTFWDFEKRIEVNMYLYIII